MRAGIDTQGRLLAQLATKTKKGDMGMEKGTDVSQDDGEETGEAGEVSNGDAGDALRDPQEDDKSEWDEEDYGDGKEDRTSKNDNGDEAGAVAHIGGVLG